MTLWAFIPEKVIESVGPLPPAAERLDTGDEVFGSDVEKWATACGYFDLDDPDVGVTFRSVRQVTDAEYAALVAQRNFAVTERNNKRAYVLAKSEAWSSLQTGGARTTLATWLDATPPGTTAQQLQFLYDHLRQLTQVCIEGFDLTITLASSLLELIERSETFQIPPVILE